MTTELSWPRWCPTIPQIVANRAFLPRVFFRTHRPFRDPDSLVILASIHHEHDLDNAVDSQGGLVAGFANDQRLSCFAIARISNEGDLAQHVRESGIGFGSNDACGQEVVVFEFRCDC